MAATTPSSTVVRFTCGSRSAITVLPDFPEEKLVKLQGEDSGDLCDSMYAESTDR